MIPFKREITNVCKSLHILEFRKLFLHLKLHTIIKIHIKQSSNHEAPDFYEYFLVYMKLDTQKKMVKVKGKCILYSLIICSSLQSNLNTRVARTPMARIPWLMRTHF